MGAHNARIDGTRNYARDLPCCVTAIALLDRGVPVVAVTRDLFAGTEYRAVRGGGAHSGDRVLRVADRLFDRHSLVTFQPAEDGSTYDEATWLRRVHVRNFGTTALHLALVAEGCVDGAVCFQNRLWDIAGGTLLIEEAGGVITQPDGSPIAPFDLMTDPRGDRSFIAGSAAVHPLLVAGMKRPA